MRSTEDYLALAPPLHAGRPKFMATVAFVLQPFVDQQTLLAALPSYFDLDEAVGVQLEAVGIRIGRSRNIPIPVQNPWFSFDMPGLGFDQGYIQGPYDGTALASLDDTTYRRLLRAVIAANNSNGTLADIQNCINIYFNAADYPNTTIFVVDTTDFPNTDLWFSFDDPQRGFEQGYIYSEESTITNLDSMDLCMAVGIAGQIPNPVDLEILWQLLIPFKPAAVRIDWACTTLDGAPVFGFDIETPLISGFDVGSIGNTPDWVAKNVTTGIVGISYLTTDGLAIITTDAGVQITIG